MNMPAISEDEQAAELDEPPDQPPQNFHKSRPKSVRRESLLTRALHTDSESHDEDAHEVDPAQRQTSRSSTCSNFSGRFEFTSDDGLASNGTRASTPESHPRVPAFTKPDYAKPASKADVEVAPDEKPDPVALHQKSVSPFKSETSEPQVEAELGRKRCISFACGRNNAAPAKPAQSEPERKEAEPAKRPCLIKFACGKRDQPGGNAPEQMTKPKRPDPPQRKCSIKFACPSKPSLGKLEKEEGSQRPTRHVSPPPPPRAMSPSTTPTESPRRMHRVSDTTLKSSAKRIRAQADEVADKKSTPEHPAEATEFHEFASADERVEEWVQESTHDKAPLTVADTLKKENVIRQLGEEAEEEALAEEETEDALSDEESDDEVSDGGFQTDDEDGFADSDDEEDEDGDYQWWAPRRSSPPEEASMLPSKASRPSVSRTSSESSVNSVIGTTVKTNDTPKAMARRKSETLPVPIRPGTPELPDSTDFVCGTLDEDRPMELAYASCVEQRKAAKHKPTPQDLDPTFPTSDPEADSDEDEEEDDARPARDESDDVGDFLHGPLENIHGEEERGRKRTKDGVSPPKVSQQRLKSPPPKKPVRSPAGAKRTKSPAPATMKRLHSPAPPKRLHSPPPPKRLHSPPPRRKLHSPPPRRDMSPAPASTPRPSIVRVSPPTPRQPVHTRSPPCSADSPTPASTLESPPSSLARRATYSGIDPIQIPFGTAFLGARPTLTHTTSLPRSPAPFARQRHCEFAAGNWAPQTEDTTAPEYDDADETGNDTARESGNNAIYTRGAIDIVQGLEQKRRRRRQKFFEKYCQHKERKRERGEHKARARPKPGKGAQRMRQIGIDCAEYRGKRVLSV